MCFLLHTISIPSVLCAFYLRIVPLGSLRVREVVVQFPQGNADKFIRNKFEQLSIVLCLKEVSRSEAKTTLERRDDGPQGEVFFKKILKPHNTRTYFIDNNAVTTTRRASVTSNKWGVSFIDLLSI